MDDEQARWVAFVDKLVREDLPPGAECALKPVPNKVFSQHTPFLTVHNPHYNAPNTCSFLQPVPQDQFPAPQLLLPPCFATDDLKTMDLPPEAECAFKPVPNKVFCQHTPFLTVHNPHYKAPNVGSLLQPVPQDRLQIIRHEARKKVKAKLLRKTKLCNKEVVDAYGRVVVQCRYGLKCNFLHQGERMREKIHPGAIDAMVEDMMHKMMTT
jgi:hypothetical protein